MAAIFIQLIITEEDGKHAAATTHGKTLLRKTSLGRQESIIFFSHSFWTRQEDKAQKQTGWRRVGAKPSADAFF